MPLTCRCAWSGLGEMTINMKIFISVVYLVVPRWCHQMDRGDFKSGRGHVTGQLGVPSEKRPVYELGNWICNSSIHQQLCSVTFSQTKAAKLTLNLKVLLCEQKKLVKVPACFFFSLPPESVSVEGNERRGSEVCYCPRHHHLSAPSASTLCPVSGSCCCQ